MGSGVEGGPLRYDLVHPLTHICLVPGEEDLGVD